MIVVLILFYADEAMIAAMPREERNALVERHVHFNHEVLAKHATVLATRGLEPTFAAVTVRPGAAGPVVTPGPATQTAEVLGGFYLIECTDWDEAVELAKRYPMPDGLGCLEVRPVVREWDYAPSAHTEASPETVWRVYCDVAAWPSWQHDVEGAALDGPFTGGASGSITPAGHGTVPLRIVAAVDEVSYTSEVELADGVVLRLEHTLDRLAGGGTRITHRVTMPRSALDLFGLDFSPRFNAGMRATLATLADHATALERGAVTATTRN